MLKILLTENSRDIEQKKIRQKELKIIQSTTVRKDNYIMCKGLIDTIFEISDVSLIYSILL